MSLWKRPDTPRLHARCAEAKGLPRLLLGRALEIGKPHRLPIGVGQVTSHDGRRGAFHFGVRRGSPARHSKVIPGS